MSTEAERAQVAELIAQLPGRAVRTNGDDVAFDTAWEIRAFALAVAAYEQGQYKWDEFRDALIDSIQGWEQADDTGQPWRYYDHWLNALEDMLAAGDVVGQSEVDERMVAVLNTPWDVHHQPAKRDPVMIDPARSAS